MSIPLKIKCNVNLPMSTDNWWLEPHLVTTFVLLPSYPHVLILSQDLLDISSESSTSSVKVRFFNIT